MIMDTRMLKVSSFLVVAACHQLCAVANAQLAPIPLQKRDSVEADVAFQSRFASLRDSVNRKDFKRLEESATSIHQEWGQREAEPYFALMLSVVRSLTFQDFGFDNRQQRYDLAKNYARLALLRADEMKPSTRQQFLFALMLPANSNENVEVYRGELKLIAAFWVSLDEKIDLKFDPKTPENRAYLKIAPQPKRPLPLDQITFSSMAPEDVKDPETRAAYEVALKENARKAQKILEQADLKTVEAEFSLRARSCIFWLCSQSLLSVDDVSQVTEAMGVNPQRKKELLFFIAAEFARVTELKKRALEEQPSAVAAD